MKKMKVTVIRFDGFRAEVIETIERSYRMTGRRDRRGNLQQQVAVVSYKGKARRVFRLVPDQYNIPTADVLTID